MKLKVIDICPMCGIRYKKIQRTQVTCGSEECRRKWRNTTRFNKLVKTKKCKTCKQSFTTSDPRKIYCCYNCAHAPRGKVTLTCELCGKEFTSIRENVRFCSKKCRSHNNRKKVEHPQKKCEYCGKLFIPKSSRGRFCCKKCLQNWHGRNYRKTHPGYYDEYDKNRKAQTHKETCLKKNTEMSNFLMRYDIYNPLDPSKIDTMQFANSLHLERITVNKCRCLDCGTEFVVSKSPDSTLEILKKRKTTPCPKCGVVVGSGVRGPSSAELELRNLYPEFTEYNVRPPFMEGMELDLYSPSMKIAIEFNGIVWHSTKHDTDTYRSKRKADLCEKAGVTLIQIWETEWFQKKECVIETINKIMNRHIDTIPITNLTTRVMESNQEKTIVSKFLKTNHILGNTAFKWAVAIMNENEIEAVCCFNHDSKSKWMLTRYATRLHISVPDGLNSCISMFIKCHPDVGSIVSVADRRWECSNDYVANGFSEELRTNPTYLYTDLKPNHPLKRRINIQHGWYKLYDAGKIIYKMNFT